MLSCSCTPAAGRRCSRASSWQPDPTGGAGTRAVCPHVMLASMARPSCTPVPRPQPWRCRGGGGSTRWPAGSGFATEPQASGFSQRSPLNCRKSASLETSTAS
jgi:hypothetical protein